MHLFKSILIHLALLTIVGLMLHMGTSQVGQQSSIPLENVSVPGEVKKVSPHIVAHEEVSKEAEPPSINSNPASTRESAISATDMQKYLHEVAMRIDRIKQYPKEARIKEQEGTVEVMLEVAPDGKILNTSMAAPSVFESLNRSALTAIQKLGALPPLPLGSGGKPLLQPVQLRIPIRFQLL